MIQPKKTKHRKAFRGRTRGKALRGTTIVFGDYGLKAVGRGRVTSNQLEAARRAITHHLKRRGKVWIRVFPDKPVTRKPSGVRMGGGKGDVVGYIVVVKPGRIVFEVAGVDEEAAKEAFRRAGHKLPLETRMVTR